MRTKIVLLLFTFFHLSTLLVAQKINNMIGHREVEVTTSFLLSRYSEFSLSTIIRKPVGKTWKMGGGFKLAWGSLNEGKGEQSFYPSVLFDVARYIDHNQQWSLHLQPEYYFFTREYDPYSGHNPFRGDYTSTGNYKMGFSFSFIAGNRTIISKKLQLILCFFNSYQYVKKTFYYEYQSNPGQLETIRWNKIYPGGGIKLGLVF